jgi:hypothetical protein
MISAPAPKNFKAAYPAERNRIRDKMPRGVAKPFLEEIGRVLLCGSGYLAERLRFSGVRNRVGSRYPSDRQERLPPRAMTEACRLPVGQPPLSLRARRAVAARPDLGFASRLGMR